jgi:hypothetical protein
MAVATSFTVERPMRILPLSIVCVALLVAPCCAQFGTLPPNMNNPGALLPPQGIVGNPSTMPSIPGAFGNGLGGSGFVPGGQNMGGQGMSLSQYMQLRFLQGMAGRRSSGPHYGVSNPFVTPNDPYNAGYQQPQTSLKPPKHVPVKMSAEQRRAEAKRLAEERKAHAAELANEKKAKAAQKKPVAKKDAN